MARTPNTRHDETITTLIAEHRSVTDIAKTLGVSDPTVYKAIRRLGLDLPSKTAPAPTTAKATTKRTPSLANRAASPMTTTKAKAKPKVVAATDPSAPAPKKAPARKSAAAVSKSAPTRAAGLPATPVAATTSVELVPVAQVQDLLTVRVEKGVELLKNLSARIVKHERELANLRQRYADTLETLALP